MKRMICASFMTLFLGLLASPLLAASGPEMIPETAAAVMRLKAPKDTLKQASDFVNSVQPGFGAMVQGQAGMLGVGISNPTMQGVDQSKDWWAAVFLEANEEPGVVFIIPAIDTDAMEEAIGEGFTFMAKDKYGIYSDNEAAMEAMKKHLDSPRATSIADIASPKMSEMVEEANLAVAVNLVLAKEIYANELEEMRSGLEEGFEEAQSQMLEVPGMNLDWVPGLLEKVQSKIIVAVEDAQGYAVTMTISEGGLSFEEYLEFGEGSRSAAFLANHPPKKMVMLDKLPADQLAYGGFSGTSDELVDWSMKLVSKMFDLEEEQEKEWQELAAEMKDIQYGSSAGAFSLGDMESGLLRMVTIQEVTPVDKFRQTTEKAAKLMDGLEMPGVSQEMTFDKKHEEINGKEVDLMVTTQKMEGENQFGGIQAQVNQMLYGGEGVETRLAYLNDLYIQTIGGGTKSMENAISAYESEATSADTVLARDSKPLADSNFIGMIDIPTLIVDVLKIAVDAPQLPPMPFDQESLEDLEVQRSYLGVSVTTSDRACAGKLYIPKETIQAGMSLFMFFQQMQAQGQRNAF